MRRSPSGRCAIGSSEASCCLHYQGAQRRVVERFVASQQRRAGAVRTLAIEDQVVKQHGLVVSLFEFTEWQDRGQILRHMAVEERRNAISAVSRPQNEAQYGAR